MDLSDSWSTRLEWLEVEMEMIEANTDADSIEVKTYPERTVVQITYDHSPIYGDSK